MFYIVVLICCVVYKCVHACMCVVSVSFSVCVYVIGYE